jgi:hypothetical protein
VPPAEPPAPSAVTLPAHRLRTALATRAVQACRCPIGRCFDFQPAECAAHPAPKARRVARAVWNLAHPSLARALPRRRSGLARLRAPMWLRAVVRLRRSAPFASLRHAPAPPPPHAGRAQTATAANAAPTARVASGCPSGQRRATSAVPPRARSPGGAGLRAPACECGAPRAIRRVPPRSARTAPRPASASAFASLSPPREPSRSFLPSLRARRRRESAAVLPLPPPCPLHPSLTQHTSRLVSL